MAEPLPIGPRPTRVQPAVEVQDVLFRYPDGGGGVEDLSLSIAPGELVVAVGPSGCGKTTLLRLVAGFLRPQKGWVRIGGVDQADVPARERECGVVFQSYALFPTMRVWENVAYPLRVRGVRAAERRERAHAMLETMGLQAHADRMPAQLSGGQQQRVALARALVFGPRALLLDEPLSALDAAVRLQMRDEIRRIQRDQRIATLMITHDQDEALSMADRVAVMRTGRIEQVAIPKTLYDRPSNRFVASFIGRANLLEGKMRSGRSVETGVGLLPLAGPVSNPVPNPAINPVANPVANPAAGPAADSPANSVANSVANPVSEMMPALAGETLPRRVAVLIRPERIRVLPIGSGADDVGRIAVLKVAPVRDSFHGALRRVHVAVLGQVVADPETGASRIVPPDPDLEPPPLIEIETRDRRPFDRIVIPADAVQTLTEGAPT